MIHIDGIEDNMIANNLEPVFATHPGEILKMEIEARGISQKSLAEEMKMSYTQLNEVLNEKRPVNTEFALMIEAVLGLDPEPLLKMQMEYNMYKARHDNSFTKKLAEIRRVAAIL